MSNATRIRLLIAFAFGIGGGIMEVLGLHPVFGIEHCVIGNINAVEDVGLGAGGFPRLRLTAQVTPEDGSAPFESTQTLTVTGGRTPRAGDACTAWYRPRDRRHVTLELGQQAMGIRPASAPVA